MEKSAAYFLKMSEYDVASLRAENDRNAVRLCVGAADADECARHVRRINAILERDTKFALDDDASNTQRYEVRRMQVYAALLHRRVAGDGLCRFMADMANDTRLLGALTQLFGDLLIEDDVRRASQLAVHLTRWRGQVMAVPSPLTAEWLTKTLWQLENEMLHTFLHPLPALTRTVAEIVVALLVGDTSTTRAVNAYAAATTVADGGDWSCAAVERAKTMLRSADVSKPRESNHLNAQLFLVMVLDPVLAWLRFGKPARALVESLLLTPEAPSTPNP